MKSVGLRTLFLALSACGLAACGSGGGTSNVSSTPVPPPSPPPPPPPTLPTPFGVTGDTTFATIGDDAEFRWIASAKAYEIRFPDQDWQRLGLKQSYHSSYLLTPQSGMLEVNVRKDLAYDYTSLATWSETGSSSIAGQFAYGVPTAANDVPIAGSASYTAEIFGHDGYYVGGDVRMTFDFGNGTLSGFMKPVLTDGWGIPYELGQYDFTQTVYSAGSTIFSGRFIVPGGGSTADSGFEGSFTGPQAAELISAFHAPFIDPYTLEWDTMNGLWIGKKD